MDSAAEKIRQLLAMREQNRKDLKSFFEVIFAFGLALILVWAATAETFVKAAAGSAVLASIGLASTLVGGILGFLYGVPRSRSRAEPGPKSRNPNDSKSISAVAEVEAVAASADSPTHLDQIADWLTKILLGAGLTQFSAVKEGVANAVWTACHEPSIDLPFCEPVGDAGVIYFSIAGFLYAYLLSRTRLPDLLSEEATDGGLFRAVNAQPLNPSDPGNVIAEDVQEAAAKLAERPLAEMTTIEQMTAWARANAWRANYPKAIEAARKALVQKQDDPDLRQFLGRLLVSAGQPEAGITELATAKRLAGDTNAQRKISIDLVWSHLYEPRPEGFTNAIHDGLTLLGDVSGERRARLLTYLACAYGQAFDYELKHGRDEKKLAGFRKKALDAVREVKELSPTWLKSLRGAFRPRPDSQDDDLVAFQGDKDFEDILGS